MNNLELSAFDLNLALGRAAIKFYEGTPYGFLTFVLYEKKLIWIH